MNEKDFRQAAERIQFLIKRKGRPVAWVAQSIAGSLELNLTSRISGGVNELNNATLSSDTSISDRYFEFRRRAGKLAERILKAAKSLPVTTLTEFNARFDLADLPSRWAHLAYDPGYIEMRLNAHQLLGVNNRLSEEPCDVATIAQLLIGLARQSWNVDERFRVRACRNAVAGIIGLYEYIRDRGLTDEIPDVLINRIDTILGTLRCLGLQAFHHWDPTVSANPKSCLENKVLQAYSEHAFALGAAGKNDWATVYEQIFKQLQLLPVTDSPELTAEIVEHVTRDCWWCCKVLAPNAGVAAVEVLEQVMAYAESLPNGSTARQQLNEIADFVGQTPPFIKDHSNEISVD